MSEEQHQVQPSGAAWSTTTTTVNTDETKKDASKRLESCNCVYTSCYCEENVWKLCQQIKKEGGCMEEYYVVFISNKKRRVPLWMQKSAKDPLTPVIWDYHVILIQMPGGEKGGKPLVYDLDSVLAFPCLLEHYIFQALQSEHTLKKEYHRKFRIVESNKFLDTFASDRSHMKLPNGQYQNPPPNYPPIRTANKVMNLNEFVNMTPSSSSTSHGKVKDLKGLAAMFNVSLNFPS